MYSSNTYICKYRCIRKLNTLHIKLHYITLHQLPSINPSIHPSVHPLCKVMYVRPREYINHQSWKVIAHWDVQSTVPLLSLEGDRFHWPPEMVPQSRSTTRMALGWNTKCKGWGSSIHPYHLVKHVCGLHDSSFFLMLPTKRSSGS